MTEAQRYWMRLPCMSRTFHESDVWWRWLRRTTEAHDPIGFARLQFQSGIKQSQSDVHEVRNYDA